MAVNPAFYRSSLTPNAAAGGAIARAVQAEAALMHGIWYRPGYIAPVFNVKGKKGKKPKKLKHLGHHHRHGSPMAGMHDPFHNRGAIRGF